MKTEEERIKEEGEKGRRGEGENFLLPIVDGELVEALSVESDAHDEEITVVSAKDKIIKDQRSKIKSENPIANRKSQIANQRIYLLLPFIFLTVTLLGGLR